MKNWAATSTCARRSARSERMRDPENRQMITMLAAPSMALSSPNAISAIEPAITPATIATAPSMPSQTRLSQESSRVRRAARSQSSPRASVTVAAGLAISIAAECRKPMSGLSYVKGFSLGAGSARRGRASESGQHR
jgi:hypothetical protein